MSELHSSAATGYLFVVSAPSGGGKTTLVHALLDARASANVVDSHGYAALSRSASMGAAGSVRELIAAQARVDNASTRFTRVAMPPGPTALHALSPIHT